MFFRVKRVGINDIPRFLPLREEAEICLSPIREVTSAYVKDLTLSRYRYAYSLSEEEKKKSEERLKFLVVMDKEDVVGFTVLLTGCMESITQENQVEIYDLVVKKGGNQEETIRLLLTEAEKICQETCTCYLVYVLQRCEKEKLEMLQKQGFAVELHQITKNIKHIKKWRKKKSWLEIRWANYSDITFILWLNTQVSSNYVLPQRSASPVDVRSGFLFIYGEKLAYWMKSEPNFVTLIAEDVETKDSIGYIMLWLNKVDVFTGEKFAYIYDIAVRQDYWGKYVTPYLAEAGEKLADSKGLDYIVGEISDSNQRALRTAVSLNYTDERCRLLKKIPLNK